MITAIISICLLLGAGILYTALAAGRNADTATQDEIETYDFTVYDKDGNKVSQVNGIRAACKVMKTRYAKPFESVQVKIPYNTGMSPYSGLTDMFESMKMLTKEGNSLVYAKLDGGIIKKFRKAWEANDDGCLDTIMEEFEQKNSKLVVAEAEAQEEEAAE